MVGEQLGNNYEICVPREDHAGYASGPSKWELQHAAIKLLPNDRIGACHRVIANMEKGVTIRADGDKAWYSGLAVCGSVWTCPVCARKIGEKRRAELQGAIDKNIGQGGDVALITLTFSHAIYHRIDDLLPKLTGALRRLKAGRAWQSLKEKYGIIGSVRALEVTHGKNGWHPHVHEIEFFKQPLSPLDREALRADLYVLWRAACEKEQLSLPSAEHGVDVRGATRAAQYVGKWGFASEVTRPQSKKIGAGNNPWQLLEDYHGGNEIAGDLFVEFAKAFKGRRQLFWSKGLREYLELGELFSDDEIARSDESMDESKTIDVINFNSVVWAKICKSKKRGELLDIALLSVRQERKDILYEYLDDVDNEAIRWMKDDLAVNGKMQKALGFVDYNFLN